MNMKKMPVFLILMLLLTAAAWACGAETAVDVTDKCTLSLAGKSGKNLTDRKFTTNMETKSMKNPTLTVKSKEPLYGLYLCFEFLPESYEIQADRGSGWETIQEGHPEFVHAYYELDGVTQVRVYATGDEKQEMGFNEVYCFGEGDAPEWVQRWAEKPEKTDVLFVVAHPEEELLYLGGAIPYYAVERDSNVAVALLSYANTTRRSEFLNGLWSMGYRNYPFIGEFKTAKAKSVLEAYKGIGKSNGEEKVLSWLTDVIRFCRPETVVGPDENGEGGNGQRMMVADACRQCFDAAADASRFPGRDPWEVKKLYLHLYGTAEEQTVFDWLQPLAKMGGQTGRGLAYYGYLYHKTQDDQDKTVYGTGTEYANNRFGLCMSRVGEDTAHQDFLENIPEGDRTAAARVEMPEPWSLRDVPGLPELTEKGFTASDEFIWSDDLHGHYVFVSPTVRVVIERKHDGSLPLTWFESDIRCDLEAGERMINAEFTPEKAVGRKSRVDAAENAVKHKLAFAVNMDYYTYRVGSKNGHPIGVEIRNGDIYFDDRYDYVEDKFFPNLDTLAFYQDGRVDVHHSVDLSAQEYLDQGAYLVFSFGPYLIKEGQLSEWVTDPTKSRAKNPRHSFGMIEPGHYVDIMCEGRLGSRSEGVTMPQLALLSQAAGCVEACDMDGGQTAVVIFMGQQLNKIGKYDGKTAARATCEVLGIGVSDQVGVYKVQ